MLREVQKKEKQKDWIKYSGLGVQMVGTILLFVVAGVYADDYLGTGYLTIVLSFVGVVVAMYVALRDLI